jgi:hypothetical protein
LSLKLASFRAFSLSLFPRHDTTSSHHASGSQNINAIEVQLLESTRHVVSDALSGSCYHGLKRLITAESLVGIDSTDFLI